MKIWIRRGQCKSNVKIAEYNLVTRSHTEYF